MTVYKCEILEAESTSAMDNFTGSMTFVGKGIAKTIGGAIREARKNLNSQESKIRDTFMAKHGTDNLTPIYGHFQVFKNGKKIIDRY